MSTTQEGRNDAVNVGKEKTASLSWDMSQERSFIENLLGHRVNFLLVFFALVIAGAINTSKMPGIQLSILLFGTIVVSLLSLAVGRAQKKLDYILNILKKDPAHPVTVIDNLAGPSGSKLWIIGYVLPWFCAIILAIAFSASLLVYLEWSC